nr:MAG: replication associated protein [Cressdnaviricota sp.]
MEEDGRGRGGGGAQRPKRSRGFCFTLNNYTLQDEMSVRGLIEDERVRYVCFGRETGESGTAHLQGYLYLRNPQLFEWVRSRIARAHIEIQRGTCEQAIEYCEKDGDFHELGERPVSNKRKGELEMERWELARDSAKRGDLDSIPADIFVRYYRTLKDIKKDYMDTPEDAEGVTGVWIWGVAGVGKSYSARQSYPGAYFKMANKWWDGYQGEENVILDDVDKKHDVLGHHFKIWMDRYAFIAETKGGAINIRPKKLVVTSQYSIEEIWEDEATREAIYRRCEVIHIVDRVVIPNVEL